MMEGRGTGFIIQYNVQCVESRVCVCVCVCVCGGRGGSRSLTHFASQRVELT